MRLVSTADAVQNWNMSLVFIVCTLLRYCVGLTSLMALRDVRYGTCFCPHGVTGPSVFEQRDTWFRHAGAWGPGDLMATKDRT